MDNHQTWENKVKVIQEIMELLKVDQETAEAVFREISGSGFSFSNCTLREFNREVKDAYSLLKMFGASA